jgi:hypothetical protein
MLKERISEGFPSLLPNIAFQCSVVSFKNLLLIGMSEDISTWLIAVRILSVNHFIFVKVNGMGTGTFTMLISIDFLCSVRTFMV